ncbi:MAG: hypothetical protein Q9182_004751 [Xanthomendoza sp. 2 TL-2023]
MFGLTYTQFCFLVIGIIIGVIIGLGIKLIHDWEKPSHCDRVASHFAAHEVSKKAFSEKSGEVTKQWDQLWLDARKKMERRTEYPVLRATVEYREEMSARSNNLLALRGKEIVFLRMEIQLHLEYQRDIDQKMEELKQEFN